MPPPGEEVNPTRHKSIATAAMLVFGAFLAIAPAAAAGNGCRVVDLCIPSPTYCADEASNCTTDQGVLPPEPCLAELGCHKHSGSPGEGHDNGEGHGKNGH